MEGNPRDPLYVQRPGRFDAGDYFFGGVFEYAKSPLMLVTVNSDDEVTSSVPELDDLFALNLSLGVAPFDRVRVDVAAPVFFTSTGIGGAPQGTALGDLRATALIELVRPGGGEGGGGLGLGILPYIDLPTGQVAEFLGQSGVAGGGRAAFTYEGGHFTGGADIGVQINPSIDFGNLTNADALTTGLAVGYLVNPSVGVNLETHFASPFTSSAEPGTASPAEAILSARKRAESGGYLLGGAAVGLNHGAAAAAFRIFLGGGFGRYTPPVPKVVDTDGDGLLDNVDKCPSEAETVNGYLDDDGCPDALGTMRIVALRGGTPVDGAQLTITGAEAPRSVTTSAAAPLTFPSPPGQEWRATATYGNCTKGQGAATATEGTVDLAVPLEPARTADVVITVVDMSDHPIPGAETRWEADAEGCAPTGVRVLADGTGHQDAGAGRYRLFVSAKEHATKDVMVDIPAAGEVPVRVQLPPTKVRLEVTQIAILEKVYFETNSAVIMTQSDDLLNEVAATIMAHPEIGHVEVAGHTDSDGSDTFNLDLSVRRARAVKDYLAARGVDIGRLQSAGYGESKPIAPNSTPTGKAKNRRVEFVLVDVPQPGGTSRKPSPAPDK